MQTHTEDKYTRPASLDYLPSATARLYVVKSTPLFFSVAITRWRMRLLVVCKASNMSCPQDLTFYHSHNDVRHSSDEEFRRVLTEIHFSVVANKLSFIFVTDHISHS